MELWLVLIPSIVFPPILLFGFFILQTWQKTNSSLAEGCAGFDSGGAFVAGCGGLTGAWTGALLCPIARLGSGPVDKLSPKSRRAFIWIF